MIQNRPEFLKKNLKYYNHFPKQKDFDIDFLHIPALLNLDFHSLNGLLPLTKSRYEFITKYDKPPVIFVNPTDEEYEYYESIGVKEFQAIGIVFNFYAIEDCPDGSLKGLPYNISLLPMTENGKIDTWGIDLLKQMNVEELSQDNNLVFTEFNPFQSWKKGIGLTYELFSNIGYDGYTDTVGFNWGMYFLSPIYDKKEIIFPENTNFSPIINAKYRKFKANLYFKNFTNSQPRRIFGCDSPIELFLLQGMYLASLKPVIQTNIFKTGDIIANYFQMQNSPIWIGQDQLITQADFYFPEKQLAIFCDGSDFHDIEKDKKINKSLEKLGVKYLRFSGKQISEELEKVVEIISSEYNKF